MHFSVFMRCIRLAVAPVCLFATFGLAQTQGSLEMQDGSKYLIREGDCLWNISFQFLGDPFQWPRIWQLNQYINNPDLIYPGDPLKIPGSGYQNLSYNNGSAQNSALVSQTQALIEKAESEKSFLVGSQTYGNDSLLIFTLKEKGMISAGFFEQTPFLWMVKDRAGRIYPGNARVDKPGANAAYQRFDMIKISCIDSSYNPGDTVELYKSFKLVIFKGNPANVVKMTGRAKVVSICKRQVSAELFEMNEPVTGDETVSAQKPLDAFVIDTLIDPDVFVKGKIFTRVENSQSVHPFQTLILDKGAKDGVQPGDIFAVYKNNKGSDSGIVSAVCFTAHVTEESSSIVIIRMADEQINDGDSAALIRRINFKKGDN
jgi:hypothetical protein